MHDTVRIYWRLSETETRRKVICFRQVYRFHSTASPSTFYLKFSNDPCKCWFAIEKRKKLSDFLHEISCNKIRKTHHSNFITIRQQKPYKYILLKQFSLHLNVGYLISRINVIGREKMLSLDSLYLYLFDVTSIIV